MNQYEEHLGNITLLKALNLEEIKAYMNKGKFSIVSYKKNTVIHFEDEPCTRLEIILSGKVVVDRIDDAGNLLNVAEFFRDDILGGSLIFSKHPYYPMTITAQQPSMILEINKELLFELFCSNPSFLRVFLKYVSDNVSTLGDKIKYYFNKTIRERLMNFLQHERKRQHSNRVMLNMTKKVLAEKIGVQRTSLSRELMKMKRDGLILFDICSITILD